MSIWGKLKHLAPSYRRAAEQEMNEELESIAAIARANGERRDLGNLTRTAEEARTIWTWNWLEQLAGDVRYAWRTMRRSPGFTATALVSLALGIGANTAIFSLMNAILLKTLPVSQPERLVALTSFSRDERVGSFGYPDYLALRDGNNAFSGLLAASSLQPVHAGIGSDSEAAQRKIVSDNYFSVLGVQPVLGRLFAAGDETQPVAVISDRLWKRRFGGDPAAAGRTIDLDDMPVTVIGVAPPEFVGETIGEGTDIWATVGLMPAGRRNAQGFTWLNLMGRLKPGVDAKQARAELSLLIPRLPNGFIQKIGVEPGQFGGSGLRDTFTAPLTILIVVVAIVLLIACANLASILLARAEARRREIATRLAIGAGRTRVFRQLITESMVLSLAGGGLGVLFAVWSQRRLLVLVAGVGRTITLDLYPDLRVLLFTAGISVVTGILFGLAPALQATGGNTGEALKLSTHRIAGRGGRWGIKDGLIAAQVALSLVLVVVSGLFARTLQNLKTQDTGFERANVLGMQIASQRGYQPEWENLIPRLLQQVETIPGVKSASAAFAGALSNQGSGISGFQFEGYPTTTEAPRARANWVGPRYFETLAIPLLEGRDFSPSDHSRAPLVAIVNQTMARHYAGNRPVVGRRIEFNRKQYEVIGVAKDAKYVDLRESTPRFVYFAAMQSGTGIHSVEIRTTRSPAALSAAVRNAVREADPRLRIVEVATLDQRIDQTLAREFLVSDLAAFFAGLTLVLVATGIYGTLAYRVARRTNEIGIRMALGARAGDVVRIVFNDLLLVLVVGLIAGVGGVLAVGRLLRSMLFGLASTDAATIALAILILSAATLAAGYIPARRAFRVDPTSALRFE
jgi:putative ABC transport system permease protein